MATLQMLCLRALGFHISDLFNYILRIDTRSPEGKNLYTSISQHLQTITQSIPPLMANDFTNIVLNIISMHSYFTNQDIHLETRKMFLSVVLHPSVTSLYLPRMAVDCGKYVYNTMFGTALTKVEVLGLDHCCSSSLHGFANLPHLHSVVFHTFCNDYFIESLVQSCGHRLRKLDVSNSDSVTAQSIKSLHKFQCLEDLNISRTDIKGGHFQRLVYGYAGRTLPPTLQSIACDVMTVSDLNVLAAGNFPNLRMICVEKLVPNRPIERKIGSLDTLILSFSMFHHQLLCMVGVNLAELQLIRVTDLDARTLICQCPNLTHLKVKMCLHVVMYYEDIPLEESVNTELNLLNHLHLDTYYLLADMIFLQHARNIKRLTVIAERFDKQTMDAFLKVLLEVPQKLINISFRSSTHAGLLSIDVVNELMHLCPGLQVIEGVASCEEVRRLQKMYPSIKFTP